MAAGREVQRLPAPPETARVETGAVQFGDDWPGLYIRGDNAIHFMLCVRRLGCLLADHPNAEVAFTLHQLVCYADLVERDVIVGPAAEGIAQRGGANEEPG